MDKIKEEISLIKRIKSFNYEKKFNGMEFKSDHNLPLHQVLNIPFCVIVMKYIFEKDGKFYSQINLNKCYFEDDGNM